MAHWSPDLPPAEVYAWGDERLDGLVRAVNDAPEVALDTETTGLNNMRDHAVIWSLAFGRRRICMKADTLRAFDRTFRDPSRTWIFHNAKFDAHMLANLGFTIAGRWLDTAVMHALLYEETSHKLKDVHKQMFGWSWAGFKQTFGNFPESETARVLYENWDNARQKVVEYASNDAYGTLNVKTKLYDELEKELVFSLFPDEYPNMLAIYEKTEAPFTKVLWKCERAGMKVDFDYLQTIADPVNEELARVQRETTRLAGELVNIDSPAQLRRLFFDKLKLTPTHYTKGGKKGIREPSTDADFLEANADHPICASILRERELGKLKGTYIDTLPTLVDQYRRMHPTYNQDVARCMPAGELVLTSRGYIPVERVAVGDLVLSHTGVPRAVTELSRHAPRPIYRVHLSNGLELRTTGNHEYHTPTGWVRADALVPGTSVTIHSTAEEWRGIAGWCDFEVSSWGRVRNRKTGRVLAQRPKGRWGHLKVTLRRNGAQLRGPDKKDVATHRLVLRAFGSAPPKGRAETRHLNGIAWDNTHANLCWGTPHENRQDARRHGTMSHRRAERTHLTEEAVQSIRQAGRKPSSSPTAKLNYEVAEKIRAEGLPPRQVAAAYEISYTAAWNILHGKVYRHPERSKNPTAAALAQTFGVSAGHIRAIQAGDAWEEEGHIEGSRADFAVAQVVEVVVESPAETYGLTVAIDHSHVTGGIVTHNTGRLSAKNPNCFHPDTEFLTRDGWVRCADLPEGVEIAEYRPDGTIAFVQPTAHYVFEVDKLVSLRNQHTRLLVTEEHRCLLRHRKTGALRVFHAKDYPEDWQQIHAGTYTSSTHENQLLRADGAPWSAAFIRLILATQADGTYDKSGAISFAFKKERKTRRLLEILTALGAQHTYHVDSYGRARIRLPKQPLVEELQRIMPEKVLGAWVLQLLPWQLNELCGEVVFWDGSWSRKNSYASKDPRNASWVQLAFTLTNRRAHWRVYRAKKGLSYQVDVTQRDDSMTTNIKKETVPYKGKVYCVSVPSTFVLTRLEGQISITGQSQNFPNTDNDKFGIRGAFTCEPGNTLIVIDYSALEMRLLAAAAGEPDMLRIFQEGKDIHMGNASMVFGLPYEDLVKAKKTDKLVKEGKLPPEEMTEYFRECLRRRSQVKSVGFGMNYGLKENKLAQQLGITKDEALDLMRRYMERYPTVEHFYKSAIESCKETCRAYSILGRRRYLPEIWSNKSMIRWQAERRAVNMEIQGGAADVVRLAMLACDALDLEGEHGCYMLAQIHDELVFECPIEEAEEAKGKIIQAMMHPFPKDLPVTLEVSAGTGPNWRDAK